MPKVIRLSKCSIGLEERQAVERVLNNEYLGMGKEVMLFEEKLRSYFLNPTACVNSGTAALHLAMQAAGLGPGDEILIPSVTYVACYQAASATGATPIPCDIDLESGCLDPSACEQKITPKTKAILFVHYASNLRHRKALWILAQNHHLRFIEDAAHSFGGYDNQQVIGSHIDIMCFSFDGIKNITCGEGGAIVSSSQELIDRVAELRLLGVEKDTSNRYSNKRTWDFDVKEQGWRYHMSNINAAIGIEQFQKINQFGQQRRLLAQRYLENLKTLDIKCIWHGDEQSIPHIFPILVSSKHRDPLREHLTQHHIETGIHYKPNHLLSKYKGNACPNSEEFGNSVLSLPLHVDLTIEDVDLVCQTLKNFIMEHDGTRALPTTMV